MRLNKKDETILVNCGVKANQFHQVEEMMNGCKCEWGHGDFPQKKISRSTAIKMLGRERFLKNIVRCTFHRSSTTEADDGSIIWFNGYDLWKKWMEMA